MVRRVKLEEMVFFFTPVIRSFRTLKESVISKIWKAYQAKPEKQRNSA